MEIFLGQTSGAKVNLKKTKVKAHCILLGAKNGIKDLKKSANLAGVWWHSALEQQGIVFFYGAEGPWVVIRPPKVLPKSSPHSELFAFNSQTFFRDKTGVAVNQLRQLGCDAVEVQSFGLTKLELEGARIGFELGKYQYLDAISGKANLKVQGLDSEPGQKKGATLNQIRHWVNLPPNLLRPEDFADFLKKYLGRLKNIKVEIIRGAALKSKKLNLLYAVGSGADQSPCMVVIKYRGSKPGKKVKPQLCLVGKGVTFDTGGLNLKSAEYMRLMKKDMAGAATLAGLAAWVADEKISTPMNFYLALAENAVSEKSYRPSDIIRTRDGFTVEIDNTDAEERLVMADALSLAADEKPEAILDISTLTGACKVALGKDVMGLFSNHDGLSEKVFNAGKSTGDYCWRLPLVPDYFAGIRTPFASFTNSGPSHGGAITAALFLEKFVRGIPWAHLDMYGWKDAPQGAYAQAGGSAQGALCLMHFIEHFKGIKHT